MAVPAQEAGTLVWLFLAGTMAGGTDTSWVGGHIGQFSNELAHMSLTWSATSSAIGEELHLPA